MKPVWSPMALALVVVVALSACAGSSGSPVATTSSAASGCVLPPTTEADARLVTAAQLCALDGRAWQSSPYETITDAPEWGETTPACLDAMQAAFWGVREEVQPADTSLVLEAGPDDDRSIGFVGVAVVDADARSTGSGEPVADPATAIALLDAEVAACIEGSGQSRTEHGSWTGVRGPAKGDDGETLSWWTAGDNSWAYVQAYLPAEASDEDAAAFEKALSTLLDAQAELIGA